MSRPSNDPFAKPPALSTRGSATELFVASTFTSPPSSAPSSVPPAANVFKFPTQHFRRRRRRQQPSPRQPHPPPAMPPIIDTSFAPAVFRGLPSEDAEVWFSSFNKYTNFRNMSDENKLAFLPVVMKDAATDWFDMLTGRNAVRL